MPAAAAHAGSAQQAQEAQGVLGGAGRVVRPQLEWVVHPPTSLPGMAQRRRTVRASLLRPDSAWVGSCGAPHTTTAAAAPAAPAVLAGDRTQQVHGLCVRVQVGVGTGYGM